MTVDDNDLIYADNNSYCNLLPDVQKYLKFRIEEIAANPNSLHGLGKKQQNILSQSREICADALGAEYEQVIFTSGATESIATIVNSAIKKHQHFLISPIEHESVLNSFQLAKNNILPGDNNIDFKYLNVSNTGKVYWDDKLISDFDFISLMAVNNETGVVQNWQQLADLKQTLNIKNSKNISNREIFVDTTQMILKDHLNFSKSKVDYACLSGHKIGALVGSGILLVNDPNKLQALISGAGQESFKRGGTQNFLAIETMAIALSDYKNSVSNFQKLKLETEKFENKLKNKFMDKVQIIGESESKIAGTSLISFDNILGQTLQIELESQNIFVSTSSACSDNNPEISHVLKSMGSSDSIGRGVIRISLSQSQGELEYNKIFNALSKIVFKLWDIYGK